MANSVLPTGRGSPPTTLNRLAMGSISGSRVVKLVGDTQCAYADMTVAADAHLVAGVSTNAAADGAPVAIQTGSEMVDPSWSWTPGMPVFVGANGQLTQTPPDLSSGAIWQRHVATASSPTRLLLVARHPIFLA